MLHRKFVYLRRFFDALIAANDLNLTDRQDSVALSNACLADNLRCAGAEALDDFVAEGAGVGFDGGFFES